MDCKINATAIIKGNIVTTAAILNSGIQVAPCPIILCIDGGDAATSVYGPVNGLLNGGTA